MGSISEYFENIRNAAVSIFEGMAVTLSWMFRKPMTLQYPDRMERPLKETLPSRFRGFLEVDVNYCTACSACQRACPIDVILIETQKSPDGKGRFLTRFDIDVSKCMYCGICSEECPTGCIRHSPEFEGSTRDIRNLVFHFVDKPLVPYKQKKGEPAPTFGPPGEIAKRALKAWDAVYEPWRPGEIPTPALGSEGAGDKTPEETGAKTERPRPAKKVAAKADADPESGEMPAEGAEPAPRPPKKAAAPVVPEGGDTTSPDVKPPVNLIPDDSAKPAEGSVDPRGEVKSD